MKTATIQLYNFDELSEKAKEKALSNHNSDNEMYFLEEDLSEYLSQLLEENGIKGDAKLYYSLDYCQGDGVMFEGNFEYKGISFKVIHNGHYYHSNSKIIEADEIENDEDDDLKADLIEVMTEEAEREFEEVYKEICDKIEKAGYEQIEHEQSEEAFKEMCEANEYTFEVNGEMRNFWFLTTIKKSWANFEG